MLVARCLASMTTAQLSATWSPPIASEATVPADALVEPYEFPDTGRGLRCKRAVAKGEELLAVPLEECWHAADARKFGKLQALLRAVPAISDLDASILQLLLAQADPGTVSPLRQAHLKELPQTYNSTLFWSDKQLSELKGSAWYGLANRFAEEVSSDWASLQTLMSSASASIPEEGEHMLMDDFLETNGITWERYQWAYATLKSRAAEAAVDGVAGVRLMAPGFDLFNHSDAVQPGTSHRFDADRRELIVMAHKDYEEGEQAFISYGAASNGSLLLAGGFVLPSNRFDFVEVCGSCHRKSSSACSTHGETNAFPAPIRL